MASHRKAPRYPFLKKLQNLGEALGLAIFLMTIAVLTVVGLLTVIF